MDDDGSTHSSLFGDLSTEEITSKIILIAIIVLFMAVLFVLILHLYAKLYWWRLDQLQQQQQQQQQQEHQEDEPPIAPPLLTRRQRRRFIFVPGQDGLSNTGLTPFELSSLPIVFFRQDSCKEGLECSICLSELVKGDKARLLPKCNHGFHVECIDMWFQSHSTCPICRNTVLGLEEATSNRVEQVADNADLGIGTNINNHDPSSVSNSSPEFPTNVLVWGRQDQVSTGNTTNVGNQEDGGASQSQEALVLEINDPPIRSQNVSSSSSSMRFIVEEEESKSPMTTRLRSLKRFLSRDKRVACSSSSSSSSNAASASSVDP